LRDIIIILISWKFVTTMLELSIFVNQVNRCERHATIPSPFLFATCLNFFPILYFDFRIADSRPAKCTVGRRTQLSSSNILEQTRATANKAFRFQIDSDQSKFGSWPAEQISRCECNLLFLTRKPGCELAATERLVTRR